MWFIMFFVIKKQKKQFNTLNFKETVWHAYIYLNLSYLTKIMRSESGYIDSEMYPNDGVISVAFKF